MVNPSTVMSMFGVPTRFVSSPRNPTYGGPTHAALVLADGSYKVVKLSGNRKASGAKVRRYAPRAVAVAFGKGGACNPSWTAETTNERGCRVTVTLPNTLPKVAKSIVAKATLSNDVLG